MGVPKLGRIEQVDIRKIWPNEARDFTPWLAEHLDLLGKELGMDLVQVQQEAPVGRFSLDILATDGPERTVVIENQLEATNHSHLGQLLTYAAGNDARIVIWITREFGDEHRAAIDWLNTRTREEVDFYGVEVRVFKIGDSLPAPDFRLVARPNTWSRQTRRTASPESEKQRQFHQQIVDRLRKNGHTNVTRANVEWNSIRSDVPDSRYFWWIARGQPRSVQVYLEIRTENSVEILSSLEAHKETIEAELGTKLEWKRHGKVQIILPGRDASINDPQEKLNKTGNWIFDHLLKLKEVFEPRLKQIERQSPPEAG